MFDVGFLELVVIMVLGLLVLGPERLPKAAQKVGYWFGKARRYVEGMKSQVEAEFDTSEVKRLLHNQEVQIRELQTQITESGNAINNELQNEFDDDDPGNSHDDAAVKADGPQYDIIEDDDGGWGDDNEIKPAVTEENKISPQIADGAVSEKAQ
jgi:sec-independent protein translocase protein TatB